MDMLTNITLFFVDAALALGCIWLYARRTNFQRLIYLVLALVFVLFMVGIWPGYEAANQWGFTLLMVITGAQVFGHVLVEKLGELGFDVIHGKPLDE